MRSMRVARPPGCPAVLLGRPVHPTALNGRGPHSESPSMWRPVPVADAARLRDLVPPLNLLLLLTYPLLKGPTRPLPSTLDIRPFSHHALVPMAAPRARLS